MMRTLLGLTILARFGVSAGIPQKIPGDYRAFLEAAEAQSDKRHADAIRLLEEVWSFQPVSPLLGKAAMLAASSYLEVQQHRDAAQILNRYRAVLPQPSGDALLGSVAESAGESALAAAAWQNVYFTFPLSKEAAEAETALVRLKRTLGNNFPPAMPAAVLSRAERLRRAGKATKARQELLEAAPGFGGLEREQALVRANFYDAAGLASLNLKLPEADAERVYLMHAAARRSGNVAGAESALRTLEQKYPASNWTMEALISMGNHYLLRNESSQYLPYYRRCVESFPGDKQAAYCHWKIAWAGWMAREPGAKKLMEEHAARWPDSEKASAALYFAGRYNDVLAKWPMSWYSTLARKKLKHVVPVAGVRPDPVVFTASSAMRTRIARAKQLTVADLPEWAEFELQYAAQEQPFVAAMELAEAAAGRGAHDQALRYVKSYAKGYLGLPFEAAPERFWKAAFPIPYRGALVSNSQKEGLDPNLVAALIRQESEFNPRAVSRARAYGLTQVLPSTGRELYRRLGMGSFRSSVLFDPEVNLRLGTHYLKSLNRSLEGSWEQTLAAYNGGKARVDKWRTWYDYREPAEFVECIPITETREYVQIVLRNADMYRRLYAK